MNTAEIHNLFPTPIYIRSMDRKFTKQELFFVESQKNKCTANIGNINTKDNYVLNRKEFKNIKAFLNKCCQDYVDKIISQKNKIELGITQSWLNYTEKNQFHHSHAHPNSIVSGVLYFNSDKENDKIKFTSSKGYQQIKPLIKDFNTWNSETWWFAVETGKLVMFPSSTTHQVETKEGSNTRISLAFNTFYKGEIGGKKDLTMLNLSTI